MLKKKFLGIMILLVGVMLIFAVIGCNDDDSKDELKDKGNKPDSGGGIGAITSLSVKTKGIRSLYAGNLAVTGNNIGRAIVDGNGDILTLSYIDENGKNSPVVFTNSSGKQYMLEIIGMDKIDNTRILVGYNGIYEVTTGDDGSIVVGTKETRTLRGALIDIKSGRVYDFEQVWIERKDGVDWFCSQMFFIENNICYHAAGYPKTTVYKIDLTAASPKSEPISNGEFVPIESARPLFTIDGKIIGRAWDPQAQTNLWYTLDSSGTRPPISLKWATLPASEISSCTDDYTDYNVTLKIEIFYDGLIMKDLSGNVWMYTHYWLDESNGRFGIDLWCQKSYLIAKLNVDNNGNYIASSPSTGNFNFDAVDDQYPYDYGGTVAFLPFYINDVGIALSYSEDQVGKMMFKQETFMHNGVYLLNTKGFIKITKKQTGIEQTSVALNIPKVKRGTAFISKDGYLYWVETGAIKRLKLESGASAEIVYSNSNIVVSESTRRNYLTVSGDNTLVFYLYYTASLVHTYALDLNSLTYGLPGLPKKIAENDIEIKAVAELKF